MHTQWKRSEFNRAICSSQSQSAEGSQRSALHGWERVDYVSVERVTPRVRKPYIVPLTTTGLVADRPRPEKENGCGPIAGNHWLNYVTPSLLGLRRYPIGPADREDPKLARRKWQPPHNMGEPQAENTLDNTFKHSFCDQGQSWWRPEIILPFKQGRPVWQPEGIMVVTIDLWETRMDPQGPMWHLLLQRE